MGGIQSEFIQTFFYGYEFLKYYNIFFVYIFFSDNGFEDDNGWDVEDDVELDASEATNDFDLEAITNQAR